MRLKNKNITATNALLNTCGFDLQKMKKILLAVFTGLFLSAAVKAQDSTQSSGKLTISGYAERWIIVII